MIEDFKIRRRPAVIWQTPPCGDYLADAATRRLFGKPFGEFEEDTPVGRILDFSKCDDEP